MKVILLQDVGGIGRRFDVKEVPNGHALNFLIPKKMAEPATAEKVGQLEKRMARAEAETAAASKDLTEALEKLSGQKVEMKTEANEKGSLFKSIKVADIAELLKKEGFGVSEEHIELTSPIKELGEHDIKLGGGEEEKSFTLLVLKSE